MSYLNKIINLQDYKLNHSLQYFEMIVYSVVSFFVPFLIGHPQLLVGIIVNTMLIAAALNLKGYQLLPIIIAPSLGVLARGMVFGPLTIYLIYLLPFIWIGNTLLVISFKWLKLKSKQNYWLTLIVGSAFKSGFLFLAALLLYSLGIIPVIFLTAMGLIQLTTALSGGVAAYALHHGKKTLR